MSISRRQWLAFVAAGVIRVPLARAQDSAVEARIRTLIAEYEAQGFHRTGTDVDAASGRWLAEQVSGAGLTAALEPFDLQRVDPIEAALTIGSRRIDGLPLFDAAFSGDQGVEGRLGPPGGDADIALVETAVNAAGAGALGELRRANRVRAIVAVTRGQRPGLAPSNADLFDAPYGPPVLQVSSEHGAWLAEQARTGAPVKVVTLVRRTPVTATNVTTQIAGTNSELAPVVVMTPRSGWYWCASERGGGIACWLEVMRALRTAPPERTVHFVASSGHELGHLGIDAFIAARQGIVTRATAWLHLGANIGAAVTPAITLQASSDALDGLVSAALTAQSLTVTRRTPRGNVPGGEAEAVHRGGGRYVSTIGGNGLFHTLDDRGPHAIDAPVIARFSRALAEVVRQFAAADTRA